jgi:hypothetical protein
MTRRPSRADAAHDVLAAEEFAMPAPDPELHARAERPHDVLAADEFAMPGFDPELHARAEPAHDVLAADEYGMPAADPDLHHRHVALPPDPSGFAEPHDVLAAEAYAMPAPRRREPGAGLVERRGGGSRLAVEAGLLLVALLLVRRLLRRG